MNGFLEAMMTGLSFAYRQRMAMYDAIDYLRQLLTFKVPFKQIISTFLIVIELFNAALFDSPRHVRGPEIDLTGYELAWEDEFEGDALNLDNWHNRKEGASRSGYATESLVSVKDGNLILDARYIEDGKYGDGWYACEIETNDTFCGGYIEMRAKLGESKYVNDFWSTFWITCNGVYDADISQGGPGGCEIDIVESFHRYDNAEYNKTIVPAVWCNGVDDNPDTTDGRNLGTYIIPGDNPFTTYHTYGLMWTADEYIWYIDGQEVTRLTFGNGPSRVGEYIVLGIGVPVHEITERAKDDNMQMVIDYVRVYQTPEGIN